MDRRAFLKTVPAFTVLAGTAPSLAGDLKPIKLLKPKTDGGKSVLASLWERKTNRNISDQQLPPQVLSNLLWAAFGINREKASFGKPGRTAASASNSQEIDLYVALPKGVYLYESVGHRLEPVVAGDFRARSGRRSAAQNRTVCRLRGRSAQTADGDFGPSAVCRLPASANPHSIHVSG